MKAALKIALILGTSVLALGSALPTLAGTKNVTVTLHNLAVMPLKKNSMADCSVYSNKSYTINRKAKKQWIGKSLYLTNTSWNLQHLKNGLTKATFTGTAVFIDAKGKKHKSKEVGYDIGVAGSNMMYGVFTNGFCKGFYKLTMK
jgi:hypothetical protein